MLVSGTEKVCEFCDKDFGVKVNVYLINGKPFDLHSSCAKRISILTSRRQNRINPVKV